jgi:hypothetical protein
MDEEEKKAYEFSVGGFNLKLNNTYIAMAIPILSALGGASWGAFQFYQDYMDMKQQISAYVAPDLSEFDKRLAIIEKTSAETLEYTRDIKNDLKSDIRRIETLSEQVERSSKVAQRDTDEDIRSLRKDVRSDLDKARKDVQDSIQTTNGIQKEIAKEMVLLKKDIDNRIQKAMDNPLTNQ